MTTESIFLQSKKEVIKIRPFKGNDCTVIALQNAFGITYDLALTFLRHTYFSPFNEVYYFDKKYRVKNDFTSSLNIQKLMINFGRFNSLNLWSTKVELSRNEFIPRKEDGSLLTVEDFAKENPTGLFFVHSLTHIAVLKDGYIIDGWNSKDRELLGYTKIDKKQAMSILKEFCEFKKIDFDKHLLWKQNRSHLTYLKKLNKNKLKEKGSFETLKEYCTRMNEDIIGKKIEVEGTIYQISMKIPRKRKFKYYMGKIGTDGKLVGSAYAYKITEPGAFNARYVS